jgi:adenosylhomocysteinase
MDSTIRDISLAPAGQARIDWVKSYMPLLTQLKKEFECSKPLKGRNIAVSVHLEAKTAYLCLVLASGGAQVSVTGSNPLSTQDAIAAALVKSGITVHAWYDATDREYEEHLNKVLDIGPDIIIDDGGDLVSLLHSTRQELCSGIIGGCEETTTGVLRLRAREGQGQLKFPMIAVNDAYCKYLFDNRYGTGQSVWDGIMRTTNLIIAGKNVVVAGYGWCGKGVAMKAKGLGANVVIVEVDPIKAVEAVMDGFRVMAMEQAAELGDIFITVTGCTKVIRREHFERMKDGVLLANAGHFDVEICKPDLEDLAVDKGTMGRNIEGYVMDDGRVLNLLAQGRLVNLASGDGHPAEIMDMSFALQALSVKHLLDFNGQLEPKVYGVPEDIDRRVAHMKLQALGIKIDTLTQGQQEYLSSY